MKLAIFYHIYQYGEWRKMFEEQIITLQQSGLWDAADYIHFGVNGNLPLPYEFIKVNKVQHNTFLVSETDTLKDLWLFASNNPDYKILYIHTKGVAWSAPTNDEDKQTYENVTYWRKYLEFFNIKHWKICVNLLDEYDCVGTEWETNLSNHHFDESLLAPHYAGTFWWANASYINKLDLGYIYNTKLKNLIRYRCEFWIGTANPKAFSFHNTNTNKYYNPPLPQNYEHIIENYRGDM